MRYPPVRSARATVPLPAALPYGRSMWWWILTGVVVAALVVVWLVLQHQTDLLGRSRRREETDPEVARALREVRRDIDRGNQYPHRGF